MKTIATIVGARPQFIKASVVSRALRARPTVREVIIHTGQHYDFAMNEVFFEELELPAPDYWLGIGSGTHGEQTGRMLEAIEKVLVEIQPDWVLVYGDTNSTLAGALAAAKMHLPVAHVEAGLRSFNRRMPEEINRVLTDHLSTLLFAPTETAMKNLQREGIPAKHIALVGDVMYDAALHYAEKARQKSTILERLRLSPGGYILATIHRAENTDAPERLRVILDALAQLSHHAPVVVPLHPRTRQRLQSFGIAVGDPDGLSFIDPVGYLDMVQLESHAAVIITDSGGVQKEAFFYRVPCVTVREETEWVELVELGWNRLAPPISIDSIVETVLAVQGTSGREGNIYGVGDAAQRIADYLSKR
ncbi:MAG: UDP-N-acetylglucosamine 2-epimerase (non-hydrolyzing) [Fimbriimonadales bacterium]|nr:UDP-N-acetylglucosamine 2-epimerase (non-hydrolyzing) [Fimbriimonadales bacterium]